MFVFQIFNFNTLGLPSPNIAAGLPPYTCWLGTQNDTPKNDQSFKNMASGSQMKLPIGQVKRLCIVYKSQMPQHLCCFSW